LYTVGDSLVREPRDTTRALDRYRIGTVNLATTPHTITVDRNITIDSGDVVYSYRIATYGVNSRKLFVNSADSVIAENIDTLRITFLTKASTATTNWTTMKYCKLEVTARSAGPDRNYKQSADHYRRFSLSTTFRLRNKL
jgi:hypothetical protein